MLTTIQRRIARDILVVFAVSLFAMTVMVMLIGVAREAINQGLGIDGVLQMLPYATPNALSLGVPGTALFSVCCVYGRMSADNEFTAMQSVGISPLPAILPAIVITTLLSVTTVGLINVAFTWGHRGIEKVVMSSIETVAYRVLEQDRHFERGPLSMTVRDVDGKTLVEPIINIRRKNGDSVQITARRAVLAYDDQAEMLTLSITNGSATVGEKASFHFPGTIVQNIPLSTHPPYHLLTANPSHMPLSDIRKAYVQQGTDIRRREGSIAVSTGFSLLTSHTRSLHDSESQVRKVSLVKSQKRLHRLMTEIHRRWASGFTCFAMSMVGIPLAMRLRTADTITTFGIVFLPTLLIYYPLFALTLDMAKDGRIASPSVWAANALFVTIGLVMMQKNTQSPA